MVSKHEVTDEMEREAMSRLFELIDAVDFESVLLELNEWLLQDPTHRLAWEGVQRIGRLMVQYLRATEPGAGQVEVDTLLDAIDEESRAARTG